MGEGWKWRRAVEGDAPAILDLTRTAYAKWVPVIGREPLPMTADYREAVRRHQIDLVVVGDLPVALIEMRPEADHLLVVNVAVSPCLQKRGLGRRLLAHAESVAASLGLRAVRLYTNARFAENLLLYEKVGYRVDRTEEFRGGLTVHMSKPIP